MSETEAIKTWMRSANLISRCNGNQNLNLKADRLSLFKVLI